MSKRPITPLSIAVPAAKGAAYVPESVETDITHSPQPAPPRAPALPPGPAAMNFKLTPAASAALRIHQFKTGRAKQAIVEEALDQWLEHNAHLIA
jgi:hypothetical protein